MLIQRIELENIKSYRHLAVDFRHGTTAISGANGSGKTTLVEAIGFALFDYLPYNQGQFVREGEKFGRIVVHLIGSDDRVYEVERRCGTGAQWLVYDREADFRLEQRADVLDKLHDLFGIDRERSLSALFKDALGVPQGTFTAIFLQTPAIRKQTFDTLLQIEDYKTAADTLLEAQKQYREQLLAQQSEIQRLTFETQHLESWQDELAERRSLDQLQAGQIAGHTRRLSEAEARQVVLTQQRDTLLRLQQRYENSKVTRDGLQGLLQDREVALKSAHEAWRIVESSRADYQRYQQTSEHLKQLRQDEQVRNTLRQRLARVHNTLATHRANCANLHKRLDEVALARQHIVTLSPDVERQFELEQQRDELKRQVTQYDGLVKEVKRLEKQQTQYLEQQKGLQQKITQIEPLQPQAARLAEHIETLSRLNTLIKERGSRRQQYEEKRKQLEEKREEREAALAHLRKAENNIALIEEHRREAEELPTLQGQQEQLLAQRHRLEGNAAGYRKWRKQSLGGQCPLLNEPCMNIKQRGVVSLEFYFDGQLKEEEAQYAEVLRRQNSVIERMAQVKKYADALEKLGQYIEQRNGSADRLQRLTLDITRLEREVETLEQDLEALKGIDQQITVAEAARKTSQEADQQVRNLDVLRVQLQQSRELAALGSAEIQERRSQMETLSGGRKQLVEVEEATLALNDPRAQVKAQQEIIKQEPLHQQQLQAEQQQQQAAERQAHALDQQLLAYEQLDIQIGECETQLAQSHAGYQAYLAHERTAQALPQRQQAYDATLAEAEHASQALQEAEQAYQEANANFREEDLKAVNREIKQVQEAISSLNMEMRKNQEKMQELELNIQQARTLRLELAAAQKEKQTLEDLHTMMEMFRKLIKEAAPHVLKALLNDISAEANRIFGEIMGDRSAQLAFQNDYEIVLRRQGINRTFAQLSGGEQMSAALSVRLALLKKLSNLNLAFFDEPTQNMDELRRVNLAEQIRRVRGFDQLIVISHDDTFEQGLDSLVRLYKENGETHMLSDNELRTESRRPQYAT